MLGKKYSLKGWSDLKINCPGSWWGQCLKCLRGVRMWHLEILFRGDYGRARLSSGFR